MTSQPPTSGPITNAIPVQAVQVPIAAPRSSPANVEVITASPAGVRIAPAIPCRPRARISDGAVRRQRAEHRGDAERRDADHEDAPRAEEIAERAADEEQRAERQQVGVDDPLLEREPAAEVALDRGQRDVDDARVDEDDDRPEDAGDQDEPVAGSPAPGVRYSQTERGWRWRTTRSCRSKRSTTGSATTRGRCAQSPTRSGPSRLRSPTGGCRSTRAARARTGTGTRRRRRSTSSSPASCSSSSATRSSSSGKGQAIRVPPHVWRGVWNDEPEDAELVIVSTRVDDPRDDGETIEDFWPE